ncbi:complex I NDUFA9 subunit family protein [Sulfuritalea sp.]|uniref:complex I NDUFA9 subunit family protein n=1 Tax=Sulfuritalea sp. TaxID=2480090 RepID=UPI0025EA34E1|nr:complex I NDUFA9 subunit family protein [Sulfuritalea sp.]
MKNILVIGGSGFLGSAVVRELARRPASDQRKSLWGADCCFTLPTRREAGAKHLTVLPTARVLELDVHDPATLARLMAGQDAVISLVGVLKGGEGDPYGKGFARAHVELPQKIAAAAKAAGVRRVLHVSALKAAADAPSGYLRSKAFGEAALQAAGLDLTIFRPSVIFGRGDSFLTLFARMARIAPFFPLAGASARFQPVWVEDVAATVADSLANSQSIGAIYELCGPKQYALAELVRYASAVAGHPRAVIGLPEAIAWLQAWAMEFIPNGPMTRDNVRSMRVPSVCESGCGLPFGRVATALEVIAPTYLRA